MPNILSIAKKSLGRSSLVLLDCLRGQTVELAKFPCRLGNTEQAAWTATSLAPGQAGALLELVGEQFRLTAETPGLTRVNGVPLTGTCELAQPGVTLVQIGRDLLALAAGGEAQEQMKAVQADDWRLFRLSDGQVEGVTRFRELPEFARARGLDASLYAAAPIGLDSGFYLSHIAEALGAAPAAAADTAESFTLDGTQGALTCPICWQKFDPGDAMNIASHDRLRGDPVLGEDARLRFFPTRFNDLGLALDPLGLPTADLACPHCRRKLPPGFLDTPQHIFSIVGAPSAGKSYYLAILLKVLQWTLYRRFHVVLKDGDPTGNMLLNQMKNRLFSAGGPQDAVLAKTALEGAMYERYPRFGKLVALPRPFIYALSHAEAATHPQTNGHPPDGAAALEAVNPLAADDCAIIFYDNAGEHFEPGVDLDDSPGALHVASSAGIFFLFDPTSNHGFRRLLAGFPDPQLSQHSRLDQQDSIMAEMEVRVKRLLAFEPHRKIETPLAVIIGKCDVWKHLVDWDKFGDPVRDGALDQGVIDANSALLRAFVERVDPAIVAHAEGLARTVRYFPVSAFGHSPVPVEDGGAKLLAPDPARLAPILLEIPTLWVLSRVAPHLVPSV